MTNKEEQTINQLLKVITDIKEENRQFRQLINERVNTLTSKIEQKHIPLSLEDEIVRTSQDVIRESLRKSLTSYDSPLAKYASNVISKYQNSIESIFDDIISDGIKTDEFKQVAKDELLHKICKTIISGIDGSVDKVINGLKQDQVFRSRLTIVVNELVNEFVKK